MAHEDNKKWFYLILALGGLTIARGFYFPIAWPVTNYTLSYSFGFIRRGLVGSITTFLLGDVAYTYQFIYVLSFLVFGTLVFLLFYLSYKSLHSHNIQIIVLLTFFSSPGLVFLANSIGFFDHIGLVVSMIFILYIGKITSIFKPITTFLITLCIGFILILTHEGLAVLVGPLILFALFFSYLTSPQFMPKQFIPLLTATALLGIIFLLFSFTVTKYGTITPETKTLLEEHIASKVNFDFSHISTNSISISTGMTLGYMYKFWDHLAQIRVLFTTILIALPSLIVMFYVGIGLIMSSTLSHKNILLFGYLFSSLAPFAMNIGGTDIQRWSMFAIVTTFIATIIISRLSNLKEITSPVIPIQVTILIVALNMMTMNYLINDREIHTFPFLNVVNYIGDIRFGDQQFPPIPVE